MKKKLIALSLAASLLAFPVNAFAADGSTSTLNAGITPDSILYPLDKLMEDIQLALATNDVQKASLLEQYAQERLAESVKMVDSNNTNLGQQTLNDYLATTQQAADTVSQTAVADTTAAKELSSIAEDTQNLNLIAKTQVVPKLPEGSQTSEVDKLNTELDNVQTTNEAANPTSGQSIIDGGKGKEIDPIVASEISNTDFIAKAKQNNLNPRQILAIKSLADQSGKSLDDVLTTFLNNDKGIGETAKSLGINPKDALKGINKEFKKVKAEIKKNTDKKLDKDSKENTETSNLDSSNGSSAGSNSVPTTDSTANSEGAVITNKSTEGQPQQSEVKKKAKSGSPVTIQATENDEKPDTKSINRNTGESDSTAAKNNSTQHGKPEGKGDKNSVSHGRR